MREAVLGILVADGKVWLGLRRNRPRVWSPPGGFVEPGEDPARALCRELLEEVGHCPEQAAEAGSFTYRDVRVRLYAARVRPDDIKTSSDEFAQAGWWDLEALPSPLSPAPRLLAEAARVAKEARLVLGSGNPNARIAFVGQSPGREELEAGVAFADRAGRWLEENVLAPLGLSRQDVWLTNAIPVFMEEPMEADADRWRGFLMSELNRVRPEIVVALGELAAHSLGVPYEPGTWHERDDWRVFVMQHPSRAMRFGYPELGAHLGRLQAGMAGAIGKGLRQPLKSPGGKTRIAKKIVALLPPHRRYVEPYAGGAAVFWAKGPSREEVLNDINPDIMAVYRFLRDASDEELEEFSRRDWTGKESLFDHLAEWRPRSLADRAYRCWYLSRFGYLGPNSKAGNFLHTETGSKADVNIGRLRKLRERLSGVTLESRDALDVIKEYDAPDTVFYLDPPYPAGRDLEFYGEHEQHAKYFRELVNRLKGIEGKFLLSCNAASLKLVEIPQSWRVRRIVVPYTMDWTTPGQSRRYELLVANYDLPISKADFEPACADDAAVLKGIIPPAVVDAWQAALKEYGLEEKPERATEKFYAAFVADTERGALWRIMDGWGEWYVLDSGATARVIAAKWPDVLAYDADDDLGITREDVKRIRWSNRAWDRLLVERLNGPARTAKIALADLLDPRVVSRLPDTELRAKHWRLHQNWANREGDESLLNAHLAVLREMARRGMTHRTEDLDSLDEQSFRMDPALREAFRRLAALSKSVRPEAEAFFEGAEDFVYVNDYISLTGTFVYPQVRRKPNDIDFVIRQSFPDPKLELKLVKMAKTLAPGLRPHFIYDPAGPNFAHLPLYDLVVRRKPSLQARPVAEPGYAEAFYETSTLKRADAWTRFAGGRLEEVSFDGRQVVAKQVPGAKPFEPHPPYEVAGEFYENESEADVRAWVEGWLERGQTVLVQPKFDGLRFLIHRQGDRVEMYTADTLTPRAEILRTLADEFRRLDAESFIIDVELVEYPELPWRGREPKPRYQMVWLSTAKDYDQVADRERNVVAFCHDLTYLNGENYSERGYAERFAALRRLLAGGPDRVVPAETWEVKAIDDLDAAVKAAFAFPGSEGAMLKASGFPYKIQGANQGVAKYKRVIEIDCLIIGYRPQTKGKPKDERWTAEEAKERLAEQLESDTYLFRCAVLGPEGELVPIEANHITTKQDIDLAWDEERQEWEGQEGPRFWKMAPGWPHVKEGEIAYGKTYARKWEYDDEPFGYIATVAPVEIQIFDKPDGTKGVAWMFPRVRNFKPRGSQVAKLEDVLAAFGFDSALAEEIVPSHRIEKRDGADEEEAVELTHEEQRKLEQELYGDPYLVRQPAPEGRLPKTFPWVLMRHLRGIWSAEQREELAGLLDAYERAKDPELLKRINREFEPWYWTGQDWDAYLARIREAGEEEGDVAAAVEKELRKGLPSEFERDRILSRGNVHLDWRFKSPEGEWLFGWTVMTPSVVLQKLNGQLIYPLRDKVLEHREGDNVICGRKAAQPVSWLTVVTKDRQVLEVKPGEVGATERTAGAFHFVASGRYVMGVSKTDAHEYFIFVDDVGRGFSAARDVLPGRWMFRMIQGEFEDLPRSVWIANKPFRENGQWPYVLTHKLAEEEAKAEQENVRMFWNGPQTIANLRLLNYPLPENAEQLLVENMAKRDLPMPVTFEEWASKPGYIYVELFDFDLIDPRTFLVLPFAGRERAWEVTAEFKEPIPDPFTPGKQLEKTVVGYLFDAEVWTREQVAQLLDSMGLKPGAENGRWRIIEKRRWEVTLKIVKAERRLVTGIVLEPYVVDAQDDFCLPEDIEEAMVRFMRDYAQPGYMHREYDRNLRIIENWIVREDYYEGNQRIRKGTWMMTMWVGDDEIWEQVKRGKITGFSIKGVGRRIWHSHPPIAA